MNVATSIEDETGKTPSRAEIIAEILKNIDILTKKQKRDKNIITE
mgnify:FL=1